jgi:phage FluMu gp28-like protein
VSQMSKAIAELQALAKKHEAEDSQYLLGIANQLTRHSTVLEGRIKEQHEAICQLFNQMLAALEEINKAYYAHAVELIDISASLSARAQLVGNGSMAPESGEAPTASSKAEDVQDSQSRQNRRGKVYRPTVVEIATPPLDLAAE